MRMLKLIGWPYMFFFDSFGIEHVPKEIKIY